MFLPAGDLVGEFPPDILNAQKPQNLIAAAGNFLFSAQSAPRRSGSAVRSDVPHLILESQGQNNVFLYGQGIQQIIVLEHKTQIVFAEIRQGAFGQLGDIRIFIIDVSGSHPVDGGQHVQQGGFPRTGGAHHAHKLAFFHTEADPVHSLGHVGGIAVVFLNVAYLNIIPHTAILLFSVH